MVTLRDTGDQRPKTKNGNLPPKRLPNKVIRTREYLTPDELLQPADQETEDFVLTDNNLTSIKHSPEFATNKNPDTPTNRLCTSLFSRDRLGFLLRFSIAYVKTEIGLEKHVMRYPQIFATKAIERKIDNGTRKGIIWHTQGSGKTAPAYYNVHFLTDYFQKKDIVPKFYFIVDRIDLLDQASREFPSRRCISVERLRHEFRNTSHGCLLSRSASTITLCTIIASYCRWHYSNLPKFRDLPGRNVD
jgi:type I site-specific restriction-modification system R (restriction) subunit